MTRERADEIERFVFYRYLDALNLYVEDGKVFDVGIIVGKMQLTLQQELEKEMEKNK